MTAGLFVTGTDTGVGKTWVAALIVRDLSATGLTVGACKPVASGAQADDEGRPRWLDAELLSQALGGAFPLERVCPLRFAEPLAPPVAARRAGRVVDPAALRQAIDWWRGRVDVLIVEGVGGLLCPLTDEQSVVDLATDVGFPLIVVGRLGLGTINHTLLTVEVAAARGLTVAGVVLSEVTPSGDDPSVQSNPEELAARLTVPLLGVVRHGQQCGLLRHGRLTRMDWLALTRRVDAGSARPA